MSDSRDKIAFLFNKFYYSFIDDIIESCPSLKDVILDNCKVRNAQTHKHIQRFVESMQSTSTIDKLVGGASWTELNDVLQIIKSIKLGDVMGHLTEQTDIVTCECYIYIFTLIGYLYSLDDEDDASNLFDVCTSAVSMIQKGSDYKGSVGTVYDKSVLRLLELTDVAMRSSKVKGVNAEDGAQSFDNDALSMLENSKIGSLAKEISQEIDLSNIKADKPEELIASLLSGDGALGGIINKVGSKIQSKIQNGEIKHEELLSDAFSMLNMLNTSAGGKGNPIFNNPMFSQLFKQMQSGHMPANPEKMKAGASRDRLRKKLESRSQQQ